MKIFNWVHRKFHPNNVVSSSLHKGELVCSDQTTTEKVAADKQALLGQVTLVDVLGGWKDGILTIGTLGFDDPLKSFPFNYNEIEEVYDDDEEEKENDDEGEHYPLVMRVFKEEIGSVMNPFVEVMDCEKPEREEGKKNGERTTLADLFYADCDDVDNRKVDHRSEVVVLPSNSEASGFARKKQAHRSTKNGISFAKKLVPRVGDNSRPIKKLNQLMTRMLKRKIHPELEGKIPKSESQIKPNACGLLSSDGLGE